MRAGPKPQAHLPQVPNGFQRVQRQRTFHNACWRPRPRHIYHGFRTGSNGFRCSALFKMRAGAQAPGTSTTGSERVPRQCTFRNASWRPSPRHIYHGFRDEFQQIPRQRIFRNAWRLGPRHIYHLRSTSSHRQADVAFRSLLTPDPKDGLLCLFRTLLTPAHTDEQRQF